MDCHQKEFELCLMKLEEADISAVITKLRALTYQHRLCVLQIRSGFNTILTRTIKLISSDSYREKRIPADRERNPVKQILSDVKPDDRLALLLIGDDEYKETPIHRGTVGRRSGGGRSTPLHVACRYGDAETVNCIINSVSSQREVVRMLSEKDFVGDTVLHTAVEYAGEDTVSCIISSVSTETMVNMMKRRNKVRRSPLHKSAYNPAEESVCPTLVRFLISAYGDCTMDVKEVLLYQDMDSRTFLAIAVEYLSQTAVAVLLDSIPLKLITRLLKTKDMWQQVPLHRAVYNESHPGVIVLLIQLIVKSYSTSDMEEMLMSTDCCGRMFIHWAADHGSPELMSNIVKTIPRATATKLSLLQQPSGMGIAEFDDWALRFTWIDQLESDLKRDWLRQTGSHPVEFYSLQTPPKVLIFYSHDKDHHSCPNTPGEVTPAAERVKDPVEVYFEERGFPCEVVRDAAESEVFATIRAAVSDGELSGLVIFMMSCEKELAEVDGNRSFPNIEEIILCMRDGTENKPKALIVDTCHAKDVQKQKASSASESADDLTLDLQAGNSTINSAQRVAIPGVNAANRSITMDCSFTCPPDFLLYMSAASDTDVTGKGMTQSFISSLKELSASDCITDACQSANLKLREEIRELGETQTSGELPKMVMTLSRKFCIGKDFTI